MANNVDNVDTIILEPSDDDTETEAELIVPSHNNDYFSIRADIENAKRLLIRADSKSCPNSNSQVDQTGLLRYAISSRVTANDLLRNVEFSQISDILSCLQTRLSAERIFNIGLPQSEEEREIFDFLLMRYSADLLSGTSTGTTSNENVNRENTEERASFSLQRTVASLESNIELNSQTGEITSSSRVNSSQNVNPALVLDTVDPERSEESRISSEQNISSLLPCASSPSSSHISIVSNFQNNVLTPVLTKMTDCLELSSNLTNSEMKNVHISEIRKLFQELTEPFLKLLLGESSTPSKRKRRREQDSPSPNSSKKEKKDESDDEEETCPICFDTWTSGGEHRICCLKCGHLFGRSCISKWIEQAKSCPQCKLPAKKSDLRNIFARKLTVGDTSERDRAMRMLEEEKQAKRSLERREAFTQKRLVDLKSSNQSLELQLEMMSRKASSLCTPEVYAGISSSSAVTLDRAIETAAPGSSQNIPTKKYHPLTRVNISQEASCRVFEHNRDLGMIIVSTKSTNPLFRGFGIKLLSREFRCVSYQPLHSSAIRDMSFRPSTFDGTLLSCGMDKVIQLTSVTSKCVIQKYTGSGMAWCCAWNSQDTHLFYVGMERGVVKEFDIRRTDSEVRDVAQLGGAPITSLHYWNGTDQESRSFQGILIAHVRDLIFEGKTEEGFSSNFLHSTSASISGLSLHHSGLFLVSNRPGGGAAMCKYETRYLNQSLSDTADFSVTSMADSSWEGSNIQAVMSRNALFSMPEMNNNVLAATANHSSNTVNLWDVTRRQEFQVLNCFGKALDIKAINTGSQDLLGVLTESELAFYKWR